jgi:hypothetical protein
VVRLREIDYQALRLITQRAEGGGALKKELALKRLEKLWKQGKLGYPQDEPEEWKWRLCEARMMLGDFKDWTGWEFRNTWAKGLWYNPRGSWQGQESEVWLYGEQGIGDEILFSQAIPDMKVLNNETIHYECEPRLVSVFNRCLPVNAVPVRIEQCPNSGADMRLMTTTKLPWFPLGDLLRNFRRVKQQFPRKPWLWADPDQVKRFERYKGRTAVVWQGAQGIYTPEEIGSLVKDPLCVQYDHKGEMEVPEGLDLRGDIEGIMGLLANCDRLIGPSNTAIHLAASMGVKVDVILAPLNGRRKNMLPFRYFGIPDSQKSIWYPDTLTRWESLEHYKNCVRL